MASTLGNGHNLSKQNMKFTSGPVNDSYSIVYAESLVLSLFVTHGTNDFVSGFIIYGGDKTGEYAGHFIFLTGELFYAAGVINDFSET